MSEALAIARRRRQALREAMIDLEATLARSSRSPDWPAALRRDLAALHEAVARHNADTEAPGGILEEMVDRAPRLHPRVEALRGEHPGLLASAGELSAAAGPGADPADLRRRAVLLLGDLTRHRQRGADLVYDAFDVDIGGPA